MTGTYQESILTHRFNNGKIQATHIDRLALVYVRQSTMQQVERHQESTRLQYGLVSRATQLGWPSQRVIVIDEDLGQSATTTVGRLGFQRLVAEVGLDHVGIVLGIGLRYSCSRLMVDYGEPLCQSLAGKPLDELTSKLVLQSLEPAALEISLKVAEEIEAERGQMRSHWDKKLERARYTVERVFRQYSVVEPENRLVARALERQWEEALVAEEELKMEYERFLSQQAASLSEEEREAIRQLAVDIPEIWNADSTTASDRQVIVRQLIERIIVTVQGETEKVAVEYQWAGGHKTQATLIRPVARLEQLSYYQDLLKRVAELHTQQRDARTIAHILNEEGWRPAKRRDTFNAYMVHSLLSRQGLRGSRKRRPSDGITKKANEWTIRDLSQKLKMPEPTLYSWIKKGFVKSRRVQVSGRTVLIINANRTEIKRLRSLRKQPRTWSKHIHTLKEEKG